ncbi:hypothetical protein HZ326_20663 [Fusarium oxysporum f. sp. albedinis]|nr:hypothetical protein HZ326_20663 [Fusarium oxysporum f. sp. albedinis]
MSVYVCFVLRFRVSGGCMYFHFGRLRALPRSESIDTVRVRLIRLMSETTCLFSESGLQGDDLLKQEQKIVISSHGIRSEAFHDVLVPASMTRCLSGSFAIFFLVGDMLCYIGVGWWLGPLDP